TIGYYQSASPTFDASAVRIGTEVVSGAAALTTGTHAGTSPPLVITAPGSYYLFAKLDEGDLVTETNETNNVLASQAMTVTGTAFVNTILDNGQAGYSEKGSWFDWNLGYNGSYRYANPAAGSTAVWAVPGLPAGSYQVQATWPSASAINVVYRVYD